MSVTLGTRRARIDSDPRLQRYSSIARLLLAVAWDAKTPLRPLSNPQHAIALARAEHAARTGSSLANALSGANASTVPVRGIVRHARARLSHKAATRYEPPEPSVDDLASLALRIYGRPADPAADEGSVLNELMGLVGGDAADTRRDAASVGACERCGGGVFPGIETVGIYTGGRWQSISPVNERARSIAAKLAKIANEINEIESRGRELAEAGEDYGPEWDELATRRRNLAIEYPKVRAARHKAAVAPARRGTRLDRLLAGELPVACAHCWTRARLGLVAMPENVIRNAPVQDPTKENTNMAYTEVAGGLAPYAIEDALRRIPANPKREEALASRLGGEFAITLLKLRVLALAWEIGTPYRLLSAPQDVVAFEQALDQVLRGGSAERAIANSRQKAA